MMKYIKQTATCLSAISIALASTPAFADTNNYTGTVAANSISRFTINLCGERAFVELHGDGDTDLDFKIYTAAGRLIYTDNDDTDWTETTVTTGLGQTSACRSFTMEIRNLGNVYNRYRLALSNA